MLATDQHMQIAPPERDKHKLLREGNLIASMIKEQLLRRGIYGIAWCAVLFVLIMGTASLFLAGLAGLLSVLGQLILPLVLFLPLAFAMRFVYKEYQRQTNENISEWEVYNQQSEEDPAGLGLVRNMYNALEDPIARSELMIEATPLLSERHELKSINKMAWEAIQNHPNVNAQRQEELEKDAEYQALIQAAKQSRQQLNRNEEELWKIVERAASREGSILGRTVSEQLHAKLAQVQVERETMQQLS